MPLHTEAAWRRRRWEGRRVARSRKTQVCSLAAGGGEGAGTAYSFSPLIFWGSGLSDSPSSSQLSLELGLRSYFKSLFSSTFLPPTSFGKLGRTSCGPASVLPAAPEVALVLLLKVGFDCPKRPAPREHSEGAQRDRTLPASRPRPQRGCWVFAFLIPLSLPRVRLPGPRPPPWHHASDHTHQNHGAEPSPHVCPLRGLLHRRHHHRGVPAFL